MTNPFADPPKVVSPRDVVDGYPLLGVPHFQRGQVWGDDAVALLLESVCLGTPCGTVILWEPDDVGRKGVPLVDDSSCRYLLIDGQQRTRSLWQVWGGRGEEEPHDHRGDDPRRSWCLDLSHISLDGGQLRYRQGKLRGRMFRFVQDPAAKGARYHKGHVPLRWILNGEDERILDHVERHGEPGQAVEVGELTKRVQAAWRAPLFTVHILSERDQGHGLADVVALYNRINSAGVRVEAEERAFATLLAVEPSTGDWVQRVFSAVHRTGEAAPAGPKVAARDEALRRRKERSFGFKLFLRTLVQGFHYHFGQPPTDDAVSFGFLESPWFHDKLAGTTDRARLLCEVFERVERVIVLLRGALEEYLHLDDLRMLPETSSLWPAVQLLLHYPRLVDGPGFGGRRLAASLGHRLLVAPRPWADLQALARAIEGSNRLDACLSKLEREVTPSRVMMELAKALPNARSLQDRHVLMLYGLLRSRGARDFSYTSLRGPQREAMLREHGSGYATEVPLSAAVSAEKHHLVPHARLKDLYPDLQRSGRVGRHAANDIGNLTYISRALNHFETGIGSDPLDLRAEPVSNLKAHLLDDPEVIEAYHQAIEGSAQERREAFERFCCRRREHIQNAFEEWISRTIGSGGNAPPVRETPGRRLFQPTSSDRVRGLGYPDGVEDALIPFTHNPRIEVKGPSADASVVLQVKNEKRRKVLDIVLHRDRIELPGYDSELRRRIAKLHRDSSGEGSGPEGPGPTDTIQLPVSVPRAEATAGFLTSLETLLPG